MDEDVTDLRGGDEAGVAREEVGGGEGGSLDAEGAEGEEGFFSMESPKNEKQTRQSQRRDLQPGECR